MKQYDVIIIGAGPAGSMAAMQCAGSGLSTLLLEKKPAPGGKSCGGGLTRRTVDLLKRSGCFERIPVEQPVRDLAMYFCSSKRSCTMKSGNDFMVTVKRGAFDRALAEEAVRKGVHFKTSEAFVRYSRHRADRIEVVTDNSAYAARALIGADGYYSRVHKQLTLEAGRPVKDLPMMFGVECDVAQNALASLDPRTCHLFFQMKPPVLYGWAFPGKARFNVGVVIGADGRTDGNWAKNISSAAPVRQLEALLSRISPDPIRWSRIGAAPIPLFTPGRRRMLERQNVFIIGDAAGFADAWTGEGIYYALSSADLVHRAVAANLNAGANGTRLEYRPGYSALCERTIIPELVYASRFHRLFKRFPSMYLFLQYRKVRELFIPFTTGEITYRQALLKAFGYSLLYKMHVLKNSA